jgi:hypothetical protein
VKGPVETYRGKVRSVDLGCLTTGGGGAFPLHYFDGELPNPTRVCFEVWDVAPEEWSPELAEVYGDVYEDAVSWARRVAFFGADALYLRLKSADPHGAAQAVEDVARGARRIPTPTVVSFLWWRANWTGDGWCSATPTRTRTGISVELPRSMDMRWSPTPRWM